MGIFGTFLSTKEFEELRNYKYKSGTWTKADVLLNPWWEWAVTWLPMNLAANVVTLVGFLATMIAFCLVVIYSKNGTQDAPAWTLVVSSFLYFAYQTLDAIDGKQARRTGSSSPLGTLFDHGCDVITASTTCFVPAAACGARFNLLTVSTLFISAQLMQFTYLWWEYHFRVFFSNPGFAGGVTEAQFATMLVLLLSAAFGTAFFQTDILVPSIREYLPSWVPALGLLALINIYLVTSNGSACVYMIYKGVASVKKEMRIQAALQVMAFIVFLVLEACYCYISINVYNLPPLVVYCCISFSYSAVAIRLLIASTCRRKYTVLQWPGFPLSVMSVLFICRDSLGITRGAALNISLLVLLWSTAYLMDFLLDSIKSMCTVLGVSCFSIASKRVEVKKTK
eukprot:Lankesteria_metandrocarpae@DN4640_c0_g1_i3.p1